ncbi:neutral/alkaline non-lysosomal ceramidase N-terminal domain-containing protein [Lignipirellula cremea]|uniref:Neutral/alkaline non-lysosomal ceramidase n=1 Tax=Lignipirellula cremea TaxID=2528010 RepID=A0A518E2K6_9BACT|nr:neutral/alkaline non-lysosomal ceramidase N-terminal domain-containing protein [Lignipirellula cremea]QDU98328.1 Neutral/alkaline non-lysosomal ceramidase [Lignipirellula cremea]
MTPIVGPQGQCRFGIAHGDITPPAGIYCRMWGAARHDQATGVHRPLRATAMFFLPEDSASAEPERVLIALDHCLLVEAEMQLLRERLLAQADVHPDTLSVVFSHTHSAGWMSRDRAHLPGGDLIPPYLDELGGKLVALVNEARQSIQPASVDYGWGHCDLAAERDFWDAERQMFVCGFNPLAPADDTVLVARFTGENDQLLATMVNYACHPTTLAWQNTLISPDYPGAMREVIEQATSAPCVFLLGACGDLGPRDGFVGEVETADRNGRQLGYAALSTLEGLPPARTQFEYAGPVVSGATLGTWRHAPLSSQATTAAARFAVHRFHVSLPYQASLPTHEQTLASREEWETKERQALEVGDPDQAGDCRAMIERCNRMLSRLAVLPPGKNFEYPVVVWRIGDGFWVTVQGEPYNALQQKVRERFPGVPIVFCALAAGWVPFYLPSADRYGKGIYQESASVLAPGCLELATESIITHLAGYLAEEGPAVNE